MRAFLALPLALAVVLAGCSADAERPAKSTTETRSGGGYVEISTTIEVRDPNDPNAPRDESDANATEPEP